MRDYSQLYLNTVLVFCQPEEIEFYRSQTYAAVIHTTANALDGWKPVHLKNMAVIASKNFRKANSGTGLFSKSTKSTFFMNLTEKQPMRIFCPANDQEVLDWNKQFRQLVSHALRVHSSERWDKIHPFCGIKDDIDLIASFNVKWQIEADQQERRKAHANRYGSHNV